RRVGSTKLGPGPCIPRIKLDRTLEHLYRDIKIVRLILIDTLKVILEGRRISRDVALEPLCLSRRQSQSKAVYDVLGNNIPDGQHPFVFQASFTAPQDLVCLNVEELRANSKVVAVL